MSMVTSVAGNVAIQKVDLSAPSALTATADSDTEITLDWTDNALTGSVKIYRSLDSVSGFELIASVALGVETYQDTGLDPLTEYFYKLAAYDLPYGYSAYSNTESATTSDPNSDALKTIIAGTTFALLMDEVSGGLTDVIDSVPLSVYNATNTYEVSGFSGYYPGITMNPVAGGFYKSPAVVSGLSFGTDSFNLFLALRVNSETASAQAEVFITTIREAGDPGFSIRYFKGSGAVDSTISIQFVATDSTTLTVTWAGGDAGDAVFNGGYHTWEFVANRGGNCGLLIDGVAQTPDGSASMATLVGKSLNMTASSGIGLGCDWRSGINRNVPITVNFVRASVAA